MQSRFRPDDTNETEPTPRVSSSNISLSKEQGHRRRQADGTSNDTENDGFEDWEAFWDEDFQMQQGGELPVHTVSERNESEQVQALDTPEHRHGSPHPEQTDYLEEEFITRAIRTTVPPTVGHGTNALSPTFLSRQSGVDTTPGAYAVRGQHIAARTSDSISTLSPDVPSVNQNDMTSMVIAEEVETQDDFEDRVRRDVEAQVRCQVEAEVQRVLGQSPVPQRTTPEAVEAAPLQDESSKSDESLLHPTRRIITRRSMMTVCLLATIVVAVGVSVGIVKTKEDGSSMDQVGSSPYPEHTPLPDGSWQQLGQNLSGKVSGDFYGWYVGLSKDASIMAIGAPGYGTNSSSPGCVSIYQHIHNNDTWQLMGQELEGDEKGDHFGRFLSLDEVGDMVAVAAQHVSSDGSEYGYIHVYQYNYQKEMWVKKGQTLGDPGQNYGFSVSLLRDVLAVGNIWSDENGPNAGQAQIFKYNDVALEWEHVGQDLFGTEPGDQFGVSVSLNTEANIIAIGANQFNNSGTGFVQVYQLDVSANSKWTERGQQLFGEFSGDNFGFSISISDSGNTLAVGAQGNDSNGEEAGRVYAYHYDLDESRWNRLGQEIRGNVAGGGFGGSLSLSSSGDVLAVGAFGNDNVRVYQYNAERLRWNQVGDIYGEPYDASGFEVSLSGNGTVVAVGAPYSRGNGRDTGSVRVYSLN